MALTRIIRISPQRYARARLFCFPFAGGGIAAYRPWVSGLPAHVELCGVQPPGREGNLMDRPFTDLRLLVADICSSLQGRFDLPFMFFGHSMGALVSFELTRLLRERGGPLPSHLFLSAHGAPDGARLPRPVHLLPDDELIAKIRLLGGTPDEVLANAELVNEMLPVIRADFAACATYAYTEQAPLPVPMTIYGGVTDPTVAEADLAAWERQTQSAFHLQLFPGNHFYFLEHRSEFLRAFANHIAAVLRRVDHPEGQNGGLRQP